MTVIPVSHFFNDSQFPEHLREYIFAEFEACGARHLTVHNLWAEQMMADSGKLSFYRHLGERHHISFIDSHAPWGGDEKWDLNVRDESRRPEMIRQHQHCMRILASLGIRTYTMHIGAQPCTERRWFGQEKQLRELVCRTLDQLLPVAEKENMTIALENCFEPSNTPEELLGYLKKFDSPYLGCCFDAGHATLMDRAQPRRIEDIEEYIRRVSWDGKIKLQNQALETLAP